MSLPRPPSVAAITVENVVTKVAAEQELLPDVSNDTSSNQELMGSNGNSVDDIPNFKADDTQGSQEESVVVPEDIPAAVEPLVVPEPVVAPEEITLPPVVEEPVVPPLENETPASEPMEETVPEEITTESQVLPTTVVTPQTDLITNPITTPQIDTMADPQTMQNAQQQITALTQQPMAMNPMMQPQLQQQMIAPSQNSIGGIMSPQLQPIGMTSMPPQGMYDPSGMMMGGIRPPPTGPPGMHSLHSHPGMGYPPNQPISHHAERAALQQQLQEMYCMPPTPDSQEKIIRLQERLNMLTQHESTDQCNGGPTCILQPQSMYSSTPMIDSPQVSSTTGRGRGKGGSSKPRKPRQKKSEKLAAQQQAQVSGADSQSGDGMPATIKPAEALPVSEDCVTPGAGLGDSSHDMTDLNDLDDGSQDQSFADLDASTTGKPKKPRKPRAPKDPNKIKEPKPPREPKKKREPRDPSEPKRKRGRKPNTDKLDNSGESLDTSTELCRTLDDNNSSSALLNSDDGKSGEAHRDTLNDETPDFDDIPVTKIPIKSLLEEAAKKADDENDNSQSSTAEQETVTPKRPKRSGAPRPSSGRKRSSVKSSGGKKKLRHRGRIVPESDGEADDLITTPPPSPTNDEFDSSKRRSARNTMRKKYVDDVMLSISDEESGIVSPLPPKVTREKKETTVVSAAGGESNEPSISTPTAEAAADSEAVSTSDLVSSEEVRIEKAEKHIDKAEKVPEQDGNKPNYVYVNTTDEDSMVVQHVLAVRIGKREKKPDPPPKKKKIKEEVKDEAGQQPTEDVVKVEGVEENEKDDASKSEEVVSEVHKIDNTTMDDTEPTEVKAEDDGEKIEIDKTDEVNIEDDSKEVVSADPIESKESSDEAEETVENDEDMIKEPEEDDKKSETEEDAPKMEVDDDEVPLGNMKKSIPDDNTDENAVKIEASPEEEILEKPSEDKEDDASIKTEEAAVNKDEKADEDAKNDSSSSSDSSEDEADKPPPVMVDVEEFYVKYRNFSYLHCEWRTEEELFKGDRRVAAKIKRFQMKQAQQLNIFENLEEDPFNPDFIETDRVLDMSEHTDAQTGEKAKHYLVKWKSLPYEDSTWELEADVDPLKIEQYYRFTKLPPKDKWKTKRRPNAEQWKQLPQTPVYKGGNTLRPYQLEGLNWLKFSYYNSHNCILADEMGLGKTIQSLTFVHSCYEYGIRGPFLVIAPLSTIPNWQREFESWTDMNIVVYHGSLTSKQMLGEYEFYYKNDSGKPIKDLTKFNVLITTFEMIVTDYADLRLFNWRVCVIDEAHRLKNRNCKLLEGLRQLNLEHRVLLSGTPLQNNVNELFSLLNFLEPSQFASSDAFLNEFGSLKTESEVQKLQALLKPMMLRRLKDDVEKSLAPKTETIVEVELTNIQKKYYRGILEQNFSFLKKGTTAQNIPNLMNTMMELRKCCIHPYLLNGAEDQIQYDARHTSGEDSDSYYKNLILSAGKMVLIDKLLPKLKANGHRVLIFSQMVRCLDILEDYLIYRKYPFERIDGRIRGNLRQAAIDRYSKPDSDRFVFLLCTKAGGLGINLTAADTVIIYDSDWNPQNDLQAQARCHRIGQQKTVKIYRLLCRNTYEREMFDKASLKLGLDKAILQSMNTGLNSQGKEVTTRQLSKKEIEDLLKKGAYGAVMDDDNAGDKFCEEDIDSILERRTQVITMESEKGSTFSKASFGFSGNRSDITIDDPDFWLKWAKKAEINENAGEVEPEDLVISEPRRRTQIKRYGHDEGVMDMSEESANNTETDEEGGIGLRSKRRREKFRKCKPGNDDYIPRDRDTLSALGMEDVTYGSWARSECFKVEKGLLSFG